MSPGPAIGRSIPGAGAGRMAGARAVDRARERVRLDARALVACVTLALAACLSLPGCAARPRPDPSSGTAGTGSVVIVAVNDVYRIEGIDGGRVGGLARLRTLRAELERQHPGQVLLLHGGDVIAPSFPGRLYGGAQMIDVLNLLDGDPRPGRLDERMFVVFGNHEFDAEDCARESVLQQRVAESDFTWLHGNISFTPCEGDRPRVVGANLAQGVIVPVGGLRVGLFGLTIPVTKNGLRFHFMDPQATARLLVADLRRRGADLVVALTHLSWSDDIRLHTALGGEGLDLVVGGHDHVQMSLSGAAAEPRIFKADADAVSAWVVTLTRRADGQVRVSGRLVRLDGTVAKDPQVDARVTEWMRRHDADFCRAAAASPAWIGAPADPAACLEERLAVTETAFIASEERIRSSETSGGNWVADEMMAMFRACAVDGAFINSGGLRLNVDLPPGTEITRRHLEELMQFPTILRVYTLTHADLRRALENAVSQPGAGRWLQVSDQIAFTYRPAEAPGGAARMLKVAVRPPGKPAIEITESRTATVRVVANEFLQKDPIDGFDTILPPPEPDAACAASGSDLKRGLYDALRRQGRIRPAAHGRICTEAESRQRPCRADQWVR
jgi:2',3'-cyclic-nucleotide 2'-phosphodiesterase (5'-nucleotidase family)